MSIDLIKIKNLSQLYKIITDKNFSKLFDKLKEPSMEFCFHGNKEYYELCNATECSGSGYFFSGSGNFLEHFLSGIYLCVEWLLNNSSKTNDDDIINFDITIIDDKSEVELEFISNDVISFLDFKNDWQKVKKYFNLI